MKLFSAARRAIVITFVVVAGAMLAGSVAFAKHDATEASGLVTACLATKDPESEICAKAISASGLTPEQFWARLAMALSEKVKDRGDKNHEKTDSRDEDRKNDTAEKRDEHRVRNEEVYALVKDCLSKYAHANETSDGAARASEACRRAIEATGLTSEEFWKRFAPKAESSRKPEPTRKPETTRKAENTSRVTSAQLELLVKDCLAKYLAAREQRKAEAGEAASDACRKAIAASGLSPEAFFRKFGTPGGN